MYGFGLLLSAEEALELAVLQMESKIFLDRKNIGDLMEMGTLVFLCGRKLCSVGGWREGSPGGEVGLRGQWQTFTAGKRHATTLHLSL